MPEEVGQCYIYYRINSCMRKYNKRKWQKILETKA